MSDFSNILNHPDSQEIVAKLLDGEDPKAISDWLKVKYPDKKQAHLRLTIKLLQDFSKSQYADYYKQFQTDLVTVKSGEGQLNKTIAASLLNNKTYQERINEIADKELDLRKMMIGIALMCQDRAIQLFDKIQENPGFVGKAEYALIKWIEQFLGTIEKYDKVINKAPDQIIQHNHSIQYIEKQTAMMQDALFKVISELDPDNCLGLSEKFTQQLLKMKAPPEEKASTIDANFKEIKKLEEDLTKIAGVISND